MHIYLRNTAVFNLLKPTGYVMHQQIYHSTTVRSAHTVFMCFVFIWEQTATCATYSINWLVFITEMKSVYSAVRTGDLNTAVSAPSVKGKRNNTIFSSTIFNVQLPDDTLLTLADTHNKSAAIWAANWHRDLWQHAIQQTSTILYYESFVHSLASLKCNKITQPKPGSDIIPYQVKLVCAGNENTMPNSTAGFWGL